MASLSWTAPSSNTVTGYRVYFGTTSGRYAQSLGSGLLAGNSTSFTATGLQKGLTYFFAVTSTDGQGNESAYSNEASKLVQ
jgi:hypothetical protein